MLNPAVAIKVPLQVLRSLIDGQIAFSQSSRPVLYEELARAKHRGFDLKQISVAIDGLAIAVNSSFDIPGLTIDDLKSIYTGKINNWSQVGPQYADQNLFSLLH